MHQGQLVFAQLMRHLPLSTIHNTRANLETRVAAIAINSKGLAVRPQIDFLRPS
jgi:hypothetical protein